MDKTFRRAALADAPELARIHVAAWHAACRGIVPDSTLARFTVENRTERFRALLTEITEETYVGEIGNTAVGFLTLGASRDTDLDNTRTPVRSGGSMSCPGTGGGVSKSLRSGSLKRTSRQDGFTKPWVLNPTEPPNSCPSAYTRLRSATGNP
jgi:hypothetical protein